MSVKKGERLARYLIYFLLLKTEQDVLSTDALRNFNFGCENTYNVFYNFYGCI